MEIRLMLGIVSAAGCALIGRACASSFVRRAQTLSQMTDALKLLRIRMLEGMFPLKKALESSGCAAFRAAGAHMDGADAAEAWRQVRERETRPGGKLDSLSDEDLRALDGLFDGLGISGRREQEALIGAALKALSCLEEEAKKGLREKSRLYTTLGLLGGVALAVCLL